MRTTQAPLSGLYVITDSKLMPTENELCEKVLSAIKGGARIVQYRDKSQDDEKRLQACRHLKKLCDEYNVVLLINDDVELAYAVKAQGVHLGQGDGDVRQARKRLGDSAIIGVTCHDQLDLARKAVKESADYVAFGAFFPSKTKAEAKPAPLSLIQQAKQDPELPKDIPIVAIGGITQNNADQVIQVGADMIAVVNAVFTDQDVESRCRQFSQMFESDHAH